MTKTAPITPTFPLRVEILAYRDAQILDIAGPLQVFASANAILAREGRGPAYVPVVVAPEGGGMTSSGLMIATEPLPAPDAPLDTLIVSGGTGVAGAAVQKDLVAWLHRRASSARRVVSICTGAFLLAEAGLLSGRRATTHWADAALLAQRFPDIAVDSDPIFVEDGGVWTSAGVTAGIDLCLELIERDVGRPAALAIARDLVLYLKRPGNQAQFSDTLSLQASVRFEALHAWMRDHLDADLSVAALAARTGMSERSFQRAYAREQGVSPARAVEILRIEAARRLLSETDLPLKAIARRCGFSGEAVFRRAFERRMAIAPAAYRRSWRTA